MADDADDTIPVFPDQIKLGDLRATHAEYDVKKIEKHNDLYEGGDSFRAHIDRYLWKRSSENMSADEIKAMYFANFNPKAESHGAPGEWNNQLQSVETAIRNNAAEWDSRKLRAPYAPLVAGLIDFLLAAVFQNPPAIVPGIIEGPDDPNKPKGIADVKILIGETVSLDSEATPQDYWHNFNNNVDGNGTTLRELLVEGVLEIALNKRGYLARRYDAVPNPTGRRDALKDAGGLDARLSLLRAIDVDDWFEDDGALVWIRRCQHTMERSSPEKQPDTERHCWTYFTQNASYEYEVEYPKNKPLPDETMVNVVIQKYDTGFPIDKFPCRVGIMERLADIVIALFNRQASLTWHLDMAAFSLLVLATKRAIQQVVDATLGAVRIDPGDKAEFVTPDATIPDALMKDIDRWKDELHSAVQAMVLQAASKDTGDRASGVAKQRDFGALATLLTPLAMDAKQTLAAAVRKILAVRKDNIGLTVQGLDKFDVQSTEMKLANTGIYMALPNAPMTGKKYALADATLAVMQNAPTELREQALSEISADEMKPPEIPAPGQPGTFGKPAPVGSGVKKAAPVMEDA